jgi:hypothetical protein
MAEPKNPGAGKKRCPTCNANALVPILYGPLPESLSDDQKRGAFFWGGMVLRPGSPRWKCGACQRSFPIGAV